MAPYNLQAKLVPERVIIKKMDINPRIERFLILVFEIDMIGSLA